MLVDAANAAGGEDNITVVLFEATGSAEALDETGEIAGLPLEEETLHGVPSPFVAEEATSRRRCQDGARAHRHGAGSARARSLAVFGLSRAHFVGVEKDGASPSTRGFRGISASGSGSTASSTRARSWRRTSPRQSAGSSSTTTSRAAATRLREINAYAQDVVP